MARDIHIVRCKLPGEGDDKARFRIINENFAELRDQVDRLRQTNGLIVVGDIVHADLSTLTADDHEHYHNDTRWDARFATKEVLANIASVAQGDIVFYDGTNWVRLAAGTAEQVLTTKGAGADPVWQAAAGGGGGGANFVTTGGIGYVWVGGFPLEIV